MGLEFTIAVIGGLFAIVNPLGNIPVYVAITEGYTPEQKARVRNKVCVVMAVVLVVFALVGRFIFELYGITIPAFKIAGGILLFSIALSMVRGQMSRTKITNEEHEEASEKEEVGVVPLGVPLFVGPGAITTTMIYVSLAMESDEVLFDMASVFLAIAITVVLSYLMLYYADPMAGYTISKSSTLNFSGTGWGGWSAPAGQVVSGGGYQFTNTGASPASSQFADNGSAWPHYTFGPNEQGWVVQNGGTASAANIYVISFDAPLPPVPLPAAVWLLGSGLLGLFGLARRKAAVATA